MTMTLNAVSVCDICQERYGHYFYYDKLNSHIAICNICLKKEAIRRNIIIKEIDILKEKI